MRKLLNLMILTFLCSISITHETLAVNTITKSSLHYNENTYEYSDDAMHISGKILKKILKFKKRILNNKKEKNGDNVFFWASISGILGLIFSMLTILFVFIPGPLGTIFLILTLVSFSGFLVLATISLFRLFKGGKK